MYEKTGWREVAKTRRKKQWIDAVNNKVYMKSRRGFWNAYEDIIYFCSWRDNDMMTFKEMFNAIVS